jgi:hypothetical protein
MGLMGVMGGALGGALPHEGFMGVVIPPDS